MELAREFKFKHANNEDILYSATRGGDGTQYEIRWTDDGEDMHMYYPTEFIPRFIENGFWLVKEVVPEKVKFKGYGVEFELVKDGEDLLLEGYEPGNILYRYSKEQVDGYIAEGVWELVGNELTTQVVESIAVGEPPEWTKIEVLPPDDLEPYNGIEHDLIWIDELATDFPMLVREIQEFAKELGMVVEICEDYYVVRRAFDGPRFIANSDTELRAIFNAARILDGAVDKG